MPTTLKAHFGTPAESIQFLLDEIARINAMPDTDARRASAQKAWIPAAREVIQRERAKQPTIPAPRAESADES